MAEGSEDRKELDWDLVVSVPQIGVHRTIRVTSSESVAAVMIKIATKLGDADWSDYALWWPEKGIWLNKPRQSLYAYGIQADIKLEFVPVHRNVMIEMPDKRQFQVRVNFAVMTFFAVAEICREMNIRHPEELSLLRSPMDKENYAKLTGIAKKAASRPLGAAGGGKSRDGTPSRGDEHNSVDSVTPPGSPASKRKKLPTLALTGQKSMDAGPGVLAVYIGEAPDGGFFSEKLQRTMTEKCYINGLWLDSSKTLYEQDVKEGDLLYMRFKYYSFMGIDARLDERRISELYEQAKWSILTEEVDCTEEEAYAFAALQFQVNIASASSTTSARPLAQATASTDTSVTDIDAALNTLQLQLGQVDTAGGGGDSPTLQLTGYIKFTKQVFIRSEAVPDVDVSKKKFGMNIILPSSDETGELRLTFDTGEEYASWMAGCRMVMKGKPLSKHGYEQELQSIKGFIALQNKSDGGSVPRSDEELQPADLISPRILKKKKSKEIARQILEAHSTMLNLAATDAKLQYIRNWQALQDFGIVYFLVRIGRSKKEELLGIAYNRLILIDLATKEHKKTWRYSAMKSWNVNWESKQLRIDHEEEKLLFSCLSADLKIVHEFIGANIWLSLRNDTEPLDITMFVKLTGGVTNNLSGWGSETMTRFLST
eukprot:Em0019g633a